MGDRLFRLWTALLLAIASSAVILSAPTVAWAETLLQRGSYLVNTIAACGRCHTPRDTQGKPIASLALAGGFEFDDGVLGHVVGPNITPDRETGIGDWSEVQIITALRYGVRPDGSIIGAPMPVDAYREMSDDDLAAIAKYLHTMKPIRHRVGRTRYLTPPAPHDLTPVHYAAPLREDRLAYGAYLAAPVGHCYGCHTVLRQDKSSLDRRFLYAGGREMADYGNVTQKTITRNITSDPQDGIGSWTDAEIKRAVTAGIRPDGSRLTQTMPSHWYAKVAPADLDALVAFLRTIKPTKTPQPGS